jgi:hypothetical protein
MKTTVPETVDYMAQIRRAVRSLHEVGGHPRRLFVNQDTHDLLMYHAEDEPYKTDLIITISEQLPDGEAYITGDNILSPKEKIDKRLAFAIALMAGAIMTLIGYIVYWLLTK